MAHTDVTAAPSYIMYKMMYKITLGMDAAPPITTGDEDDRSNALTALSHAALLYGQAFMVIMTYRQ